MDLSLLECFVNLKRSDLAVRAVKYDKIVGVYVLDMYTLNSFSLYFCIFLISIILHLCRFNGS